jgi:hypothetical protein
MTVPTGKVAIIEQLSAYCSSPDPIFGVTLSAEVAGERAAFHFPLQMLGTVGAVRFYGSAQTTRVYADDGGTASIYVGMAGPGVPESSVCMVRLAGHFVTK